MKVIGLLGGMSWESSAEYYRIINEEVGKRLGKLHSAEIAMYSVDFEPIESLQHAGDWEGLARAMVKGARAVEAAGAQMLLICTNTMHKVVREVEASIKIPVLHIADAAADAILAKGLKKVGLLGTRFTMEDGFYSDRLAAHGIQVIVPKPDDRQTVHDIIYGELCLGTLKEDSKRSVLNIIERLVEYGAEGVVLGCTELPLLIHQEDVPVPVFDTTRIHAEKAVETALREGRSTRLSGTSRVV